VPLPPVVEVAVRDHLKFRGLRHRLQHLFPAFGLGLPGQGDSWLSRRGWGALRPLEPLRRVFLSDAPTLVISVAEAKSAASTVPFGRLDAEIDRAIRSGWDASEYGENDLPARPRYITQVMPARCSPLQVLFGSVLV